MLELAERLYINPFHSMLPRHGEIPWDGKLLELNYKSEIGVDSRLKAVMGTLNRAKLTADIGIES